MAYDVNQTKIYQQPAQTMSQLAAAVVAKLGGKADKKNNPASGHIEVTFNKQVKNQMLPNRIQIAAYSLREQNETRKRGRDEAKILVASSRLLTRRNNDTQV